MILWLDAHLPPSLASWLTRTLGVEARALRDLGLRDAKDPPIFAAARAANAVVMTKDADFVGLLETHGPPPRVLWVRLGNTSNERLRVVLQARWARVAAAFDRGEHPIEITDEGR